VTLFFLSRARRTPPSRISCRVFANFLLIFGQAFFRPGTLKKRAAALRAFLRASAGGCFFLFPSGLSRLLVKMLPRALPDSPHPFEYSLFTVQNSSWMAPLAIPDFSPSPWDTFSGTWQFYPRKVNPNSTVLSVIFQFG